MEFDVQYVCSAENSADVLMKGYDRIFCTANILTVYRAPFLFWISSSFSGGGYLLNLLTKKLQYGQKETRKKGNKKKPQN